MNTHTSTRYARTSSTSAGLDGLRSTGDGDTAAPAVTIEYLDWTAAPALALPTLLSRSGTSDH
ncbi:hypothetical protein GT204_19870 [Streptomyces sp. SID4919]|uniref:hypothetical protein n=1 Tax=Streptomyces TaxID=1883 RepID=UPI000823CA4C|nr:MULTISPECIES: hypothetical protein [Streptomyces]MCX4660478.1 hypothetical protein [Streptomyces uncialis]MYY11107.1 hypothetical protein [Streptomyces sp. SID4919]SCK15456.1 hypothetical protein YW7DRAFT_00986 [Streptomyces sp. AmelKG-E11A]